jgi:hypothetical protein
MKHWNDLSEKERRQLLLFPAYISLLASTSAGGIDNKEKKAALKLTHIKTFAGDPILIDYYRAVEHDFETQITLLDHALPPNREERKEAIENELLQLEPVLEKLDNGYAHALRRSMQSYKNHVSRAHQNVLEYFIFPLPVHGISD